MYRVHLAILIALGCTYGAPAADYPERPVRIIVPFTAGGASDIAARAIGKSLSRLHGKPVVIDNRPGANGAIAAQTVLNAVSDGHTLLWGVGSMPGLPLVQTNVPFDTFEHFAPVSMVGRFAFGYLEFDWDPAVGVPGFGSWPLGTPRQ